MIYNVAMDHTPRIINPALRNIIRQFLLSFSYEQIDGSLSVTKLDAATDELLHNAPFHDALQAMAQQFQLGNDPSTQHSKTVTEILKKVDTTNPYLFSPMILWLGFMRNRFGFSL